eukprot:13561749-Alexandrium_andersonii.AAC.1
MATCNVDTHTHTETDREKERERGASAIVHPALPLQHATGVGQHLRTRTQNLAEHAGARGLRKT